MERILAEMALSISFDEKWSDKTCLLFKHQSILCLMTIGVSSVLAAAEGGSWTNLLKGLCLSNERKFSWGEGERNMIHYNFQVKLLFSGRLALKWVYISLHGSKFLPVFIYSLHPYIASIFTMGWGVGDLVEGCYEFKHKNITNYLIL